MIGDLAFLLCRAEIAYGYEASVQVVDVSNPEAPVHVGAVDTPVPLDWPDAPLSLALSGTDLFLAVAQGAMQSRLFIYDVSDPLVPHLRSTTTLPGRTHDVEVERPFAFLAVSSRLSIYDVEDLSAPALVADIPLSGAALDVAVSGPIACVSGDGLHAFNVEDPRLPVPLGSLPEVRASEIALEEGRFVAVGRSAVHIGTASADASPVATGRIELALTGITVQLDGERALVVAERYEAQRFAERFTWYRKIGVVDLGRAEPPRLRGYVPGVQDPRDLETAGDLTFLAAGTEGLVVLDLSEPRPRLPLAGAHLSTTAYSVRTAGHHAYVGQWDDEQKVGLLQILDLTHPEAPARRGSVTIEDLPLGIVVDGSHAYVGGAVIDISDPDVP
ncbi:MAG TPA: hypothetical protein VKU85_03805, partial [bacterium]|nr:hypothetical protein [bacterium]